MLAPKCPFIVTYFPPYLMKPPVVSIDNAFIEDASINNVKIMDAGIGTYNIYRAAIKNVHIKEANITTLNLGGNAITTRVLAEKHGIVTIPNSNTYTEVISINLTCLPSTSVVFFFSMCCSSSGMGVNFILSRDGYTIIGPTKFKTNRSEYESNNVTFTFSDIAPDKDDPINYSIRFNKNQISTVNTDSFYVVNPKLSILHVKR
jgi:hypothetical protein